MLDEVLKFLLKVSSCVSKNPTKLSNDKFLPSIEDTIAPLYKTVLVVPLRISTESPTLKLDLSTEPFNTKVVSSRLSTSNLELVL